jgi:hypothetical protein
MKSSRAMNTARLDFMAQPTAAPMPAAAPRGLPGQPRD